MPGDLTEEERRIIAQKHFDHWFESASDFYITYEFDKNRGKLSKAAFELHQSVERFFACTLLSCTNYLPKSHNIEKLRKLCAQIDPEFTDIFPMENKFHRRSFRCLQRAYIDARYSEHYEITVEELDYLAGEVEKLKGLTEQVCQRRIGG
ncbi:HEPN domain-containing protein [Vibrio sp. PP-XX7]